MKYISTVLLLFFLMCIFTAKAVAQEFSVGIYPPVIQATIIPPAQASAEIDIANFSDTSKTFSILLKPFRSDPEGDGSVIYPLSNALPEYSIFDKITILDENTPVSEIKIDSLESKKLKIQFSIPESATRGDYYFSVIFLSSGTELEQTSQSILPAGIATNILLSIGPKGPTIGEIKTFEAPLISQSGPIPFTLEFLNAGQRLITPNGKIIIKNMFGGEIESVDVLPEYILAESTRYLVDSSQASASSQNSQPVASLHPAIIWDKSNLFGKYTAIAELTILEDESQKKLIKTTTFYVIPVLSVISTGFIVLILGVIYLRVKRKI